MGLDYREFRPSRSTALYVECFWTLRGEAPAAGQPESIFPDGHPELIWNLADPFLRHAPGARARRQADSLVVGQITGPFALQPTGRIDLLAVRFRTAAFGAFLDGVPAYELTDADLAVDDVVGTRLRTIAEEVAVASTPAARVAVLDARLQEDLRRAPPVDRRVAAAVDLIAIRHGMVRVDDVAAVAGLSPRQLERRFALEVGIGPKRLARIGRFHHLVAQLGADPPGGGVDVAFRCGYYDQAHLIREFREFTGGTPGDFLLRDSRPFADLFLKER